MSYKKRKLFGIEGLDYILRESYFPMCEDGYSVLIRGLPGTGKTTFALHLLEKHLKIKRAKGLLVHHYERDIEIASIIKTFGLEFYPGMLDSFKLDLEEFYSLKQNSIEDKEENRNKNKRVFSSYIKTWLEEIDQNEKVKKILMIDGLSLLKYFSEGSARKYLIEFLSSLRRKNVISFIVAEEDIFGNDHFLEHLADGVINLSVSNQTQRHRYLEISKMRYIDYVKGKHSFRLSQGKLYIYPSPSCQFVRVNKISEKGGEIWATGTGINGLDSITGNSFQPLSGGDIFIVTAEPGAEKRRLGISFLEYFNVKVKKKKNEQSKEHSELIENKASEYVKIFVSFSSGVLESFQKECDKRDVYLISQNEKNDISQKVNSGMTVPDITHPDRLVSILVEKIISIERENKKTRVVIDGLSEIGRELKDDNKTIEYTIWLSRILSSLNTITLIFVDLPKPFQPMGNIPMEFYDEANYVGHIRWAEINNQIVQTFVLSKSKYANFHSKPFHLVVNENDISLQDRGWPMVSMLSGQSESIHEAKVFLKIFDQNYSAKEIHGSVLEEFRERYSKDQSFVHVFKKHPTPAHWSFRGHAGAGHSNTKVVCLKDYIIDVLARENVLIDFGKDEWRRYERIVDRKKVEEPSFKARTFSLWSLSMFPFMNEENTKAIKERKVLPLYADIGVLCANVNENSIRIKVEKECQIKEIKPLGEIIEPPDTWDDLFEKSIEFNRKKNIKTAEIMELPPWINHLYLMPNLAKNSSEMMSFVLEILVDYYGKDTIEIRNEWSSLEGFSKIFNDQALEKTVTLIRRLVREGVSPSPLNVNHYHNAIFSRRMLSTVDQYPINDPNLPAIEKWLVQPNPQGEGGTLKERFDFSIFPMPSKDGKEIGISALDVYSLGVIRGCLAPETALMFISELASPGTDAKRFAKRRGMPILVENWAVPREMPERGEDKKKILSIIEKQRYFCKSWIPKYWIFESNVRKILDGIFIDVSLEKDEEIVKSTQKGFMKIIEKCNLKNNNMEKSCEIK